MAREGKKVSDAPVINRRNVSDVHPNMPVGIDAGWDSNVGQSWVAPDVELGKKLSALPPNLAGYAYEHMVTEPFIKSLDGAWSKFRREVKASGHPKKQDSICWFWLKQGASCPA